MRAGYFLLEIVIVLGVSVLVGCVCAVSLRGWYSRMLVQAHARMLAHRLRSTALRACLQRARICMYFDDKKQGYTINNQFIAFPPHVVYGGSYARSGANGVKKVVFGPPSQPHKPLVSYISFPKKTIYFYPDGSSSAGVVYIGHVASPVLYGISCGVGSDCFVRVYSYVAERWKIYTEY